MKIGELAAHAGCKVETVRYYEAEGLMQEPARDGNNYRRYGPLHVRRLAFILRCRSLDMTHVEIRVLLALQDAPEQSCEQVNELLESHARHVEERITELLALKDEIESIRYSCSGGGSTKDCAALEALGHISGSKPTSAHGHVRTVHG